MATTAKSGTAELAARMAEAAANLLAALSSEQRAKAAFGFPDEEERRRWYYTPTDHGGLTLGAMTPAQQQQTLRLVASGLSVPGYNVASTIIGLENVLDQSEGWRVRFMRDRDPNGRGRDPLLYYISIFGEPGGTAAWGWRFGGHHISLHYTVVDGGIVATLPSFFGANPAEAPLVGPGTLRPLAGEEDLGRELLHALDAEQRAVAVIAPAAPWDLVIGNRPTVAEGMTPPLGWEIFREQYDDAGMEERRRRHERTIAALGVTAEQIEAFRYSKTAKGLPAARMNAAQKQLLAALLHQYTDRMPEEIAARERERVSGVLDQVSFAWAGGAERRQPHYYRLQGPRLLVEYDNTQDGANHIHSVWRDPEGDFGADLLAQHYAVSH
ncbi:MAG TPA: DUF3500 domain-containing protein [Dehalococcoidia bacterium]|nr:DUF3500 domain-containing protein [Dehalococcoidia bacterium]